MAIHRGGRHDEVVPFQRCHNRTVVEDAFLFAYLLRVYEAGDAVFILYDFRYDILGAVFVGVCGIRQEGYTAPVDKAYLRRPVPHGPRIHALGLEVVLYEVRGFLESFLVCILFRESTDEGRLVIDASREANIDGVHQPVRHLDVEV